MQDLFSSCWWRSSCSVLSVILNVSAFRHSGSSIAASFALEVSAHVWELEAEEQGQRRPCARIPSILPAPRGVCSRGMSSIHPQRPLVAFHRSPLLLWTCFCNLSQQLDRTSGDRQLIFCMFSCQRSPVVPAVMCLSDLKLFSCCRIYERKPQTPWTCCKHSPICKPNCVNRHRSVPIQKTAVSD